MSDLWDYKRFLPLLTITFDFSTIKTLVVERKYYYLEKLRFYNTCLKKIKHTANGC